MSRRTVLQSFSQDLYISHNQMFTYLNCSLKYRFQYVENRSLERMSIVLPFGSAIHAAIESYYRGLKNRGSEEPLSALQELFQSCLDLELKMVEVPVLFKKDLPDQLSAIDMGNALLKMFSESIAQTVQDAQEIVGVELPLTATLYTDNGQPTDFKLAGVLDLVIRNKDGDILVVDNKTASKPIAQNTADDNNQMTAYAYLLAANKFVYPTAEVNCRFDVLRKLKTPKFEQVHTRRTPTDRRRFAKVANQVLAAIDASIFMPQPSWMCGDCGYSDACQAW